MHCDGGEYINLKPFNVSRASLDFFQKKRNVKFDTNYKFAVKHIYLQCSNNGRYPNVMRVGLDISKCNPKYMPISVLYLEDFPKIYFTKCYRISTYIDNNG